MRKKSAKDERGMITVEAVLTLVPFILAILGIISFINVFMVHNKIQYAMYQVGNELTAYTYFYQVLGLRDADDAFTQDADRETAEIDATIEDVSTFLTQVGSLEESVNSVGSNGLQGLGDDIDNVINEGQQTIDDGKQAIQSGKELVSDPQTLAQNIVFFVLENIVSAAKNGTLEIVASALIENYLESGYTGDNPADAYLKAAGVKDGMAGLDFGGSTLFADGDKRMIDIVVEYDLEIYFLKLFKKDPTIKVVQRCVVPAWLDGDGVHYEEK